HRCAADGRALALAGGSARRHPARDRHVGPARLAQRDPAGHAHADRHPQQPPAVPVHLVRAGPAHLRHAHLQAAQAAHRRVASQADARPCWPLPL
ncbi:hypothetical protein H4S02_012521, partial [Coemansia sp. RSA 2611]